DISLYGLGKNGSDEHLSNISSIIGNSVLQVIILKKTINKDSLMGQLIKDIEMQPNDHTQKLYRVALEIIGANAK
ncbi:TPA: hypothetical protein ACKPY7_004818, partial [Serratia marcescens]